MPDEAGATLSRGRTGTGLAAALCSGIRFDTRLSYKVFTMLLFQHEPTDKNAGRREVGIAPRVWLETEKPTVARDRCSRRVLSIRKGNVTMTIVVVAAAMGLTRFSSQVSRQA